MLFQPIYERFCNESPLAVMARSTMEFVLSPKLIDELFERTAEEQYTRGLLFSSIVELMIPVACRFQPSVRASYKDKKSKSHVGVSLTSVYNKLGGVETIVSEALVRETVEKMSELIDKMDGGREPLLPGYRVKILDGNCLAATEHRIFELRSLAAGPLPGKSLVVLDPQRMLMADLFACEDGHAQERSLLGRVLETIRPDDLWIADRNFCTAGFLAGIARRGGWFIIRHHRGMVYETCGEWKGVGKTDTGYVMERTVKIVDDQGQWFMMRLVRINLLSATRDGDDELLLLTNLPGKDVDGLKVAELYRDRWTLETAFQHITAVLRCEINTLGYPKAALFSFAVAVLSYNIVATMRAALRSHHGQTKRDDQVSTFYVVDGATGPYRGMLIALPPEFWLQFRTFSVEDFAEHLLSLVAKLDMEILLKSGRGPKKPATPRTKAKDKPHVSTKRLLGARKAKK